jgi:hypothetical protein
MDWDMQSLYFEVPKEETSKYKVPFIDLFGEN